MGGSQYFWRVTRLSGEGVEGTFKVEEYSCGLGEMPRRPIPYNEVGNGLTYAQMLSRIHDARTHMGDLVLEHARLGAFPPEFHYEWHFVP